MSEQGERPELTEEGARNFAAYLRAHTPAQLVERSNLGLNMQDWLDEQAEEAEGTAHFFQSQEERASACYILIRHDPTGANRKPLDNAAGYMAALPGVRVAVLAEYATASGQDGADVLAVLAPDYPGPGEYVGDGRRLRSEIAAMQILVALRDALEARSWSTYSDFEAAKVAARKLAINIHRREVRRRKERENR